MVTELTDGDYVIVWQNGDNNDWGVYGQRYNADGTASGTQFLINSTTNSSQQHPEVTALADGGFVVAWHRITKMAPVGAFMANGLMLMASPLAMSSWLTPRLRTLKSIQGLRPCQMAGLSLLGRAMKRTVMYSLYGQLFDSAGTASGRAV